MVQTKTIETRCHEASGSVLGRFAFVSADMMTDERHDAGCEIEKKN